MGEPSDGGTFVALRLLTQIALQKGNTDIMYILNYPAYYCPRFNADIFGKTSDETFPPADDYRAETGLGFNYGYQYYIDNFESSQRYSKKDAEKGFKRGNLKDGLVNAIEFSKLMSTISGMTIIDEHDQISNYDGLSVDAKNYYTDKAYFTYMTYKIVEAVIKDAAKRQHLTAPNLIFVIGGTNDVNGYGMKAIKSEIFDFDGCIEQPSVNSIQDTISVYKSFSNGSISFDNYDKIYIEQNGPMSFYNAKAQALFKQNIKKVEVLVAMCGVLSNEPSATAVTTALNRLSCSTMNQLYHPAYTHQFFTDFKDCVIYTVSNNEINKTLAYSCFVPFEEKYLDYLGEIDHDKLSSLSSEAKAYLGEFEHFEHICSDMGLLDYGKHGIINNIFNNYYFRRPFSRKLFNVTATYMFWMCCVGGIVKSISVVPKTLYFEGKYGMSLISATSSEALKIGDEYLLHGYVKMADRILSEGKLIVHYLPQAEKSILIPVKDVAFDGKEATERAIGHAMKPFGRKLTSKLLFGKGASLPEIDEPRSDEVESPLQALMFQNEPGPLAKRNSKSTLSMRSSGSFPLDLTSESLVTAAIEGNNMELARILAQEYGSFDIAYQDVKVPFRLPLNYIIV